MSQITYQAVAKICNQLRMTGDKPSARKIREKLGGSFTTITEHLKKWRIETQLSESSDMAISVELRKAILAEFSQVASQVKCSLQATVDEKELDLHETREALTECEHKYKQQELKLSDIKIKLHNDSLEFEKKLAACESTVSFLKDRETDLQNKLAAFSEKSHQAELKTAIADTKSANFQNRIKELELQLKKINDTH